MSADNDQWTQIITTARQLTEALQAADAAAVELGALLSAAVTACLVRATKVRPC